jgi:flagellar protein FlbD
MIHLHRLNSAEIVVNAELIESIESHGTETVLSLATGNKIVVTESVTEVIQKTIEYKKTVFAGASYLPEFLRGEKGGSTCHSPS